jgi:hypothetical protein
MWLQLKIGGLETAVQLLDHIGLGWPGPSRGALTQHGPVTCTVPRETIHTLRIYSDIIGREIQLERRNIVQKLAPSLTAKLSEAAPSHLLQLLPPSEVVD